MDVKNKIFLTVCIFLVFLFGIVIGINVISYAEEEDIVTMKIVRANVINRNITNIYDFTNNTIYSENNLLDFGGNVDLNKTILMLKKDGIQYQPTTVYDWIYTGKICKIIGE